MLHRKPEAALAFSLIVSLRLLGASEISFFAIFFKGH
jgi:hypothetical protein